MQPKLLKKESFFPLPPLGKVMERVAHHLSQYQQGNTAFWASAKDRVAHLFP
jgi:hypothetical protein